MTYLMMHGDAAASGLWAMMTVLFIAGLLGSIGHCAGMCGPFVLAQVRSEGEKDVQNTSLLKRMSSFALLPYHMGRMVTYMGLGAFVALVGDMVMRESDQKIIVATLLLVAAVLFLLHALPNLKRFIPSLPLPKFIKSKIDSLRQFYTQKIARLSAPFSRRSSSSHRFVYGLILGFLPCGFLYAALMVAASTGNFVWGMAGMASFALGTMPPLVMMATAGSAVARRFPSFSRLAVGAGMIFNSISLFMLAGHTLAV